MNARFYRVFCLITVITIFGTSCGSKQVKEETVDEILEKTNHAARQAFEKEDIDQAATLYRQALDRAYLRDDAMAIADAQYNLAVCLMILQSYEEALVLVNQTLRAKQPISADLLFLKATLFYRQKKSNEAWKITEKILSSAPKKFLIQIPTHFLRGLIASERGNIAQLNEAIAALGQPTQPNLRADREELLGHLGMAEKNWQAAIKAFDAATTLRREILDYRGMVLTLAKAGEACEKEGQLVAASRRYLRAGQSAALQNDSHHAKTWLTRALQLAEQGGDKYVVQAARFQLTRLEEENQQD